MRVLPVQLQKLTLSYVSEEDEVGADDDNDVGDVVYTALVELQHLSCLQQLRISAESFANGSSVPTNLQSLWVGGEWPAQGLLEFSDMQQHVIVCKGRV